MISSEFLADQAESQAICQMQMANATAASYYATLKDLLMEHSREQERLTDLLYRSLTQRDVILAHLKEAAEAMTNCEIGLVTAARVPEAAGAVS